MTCPYCGEDIKDDALLCRFCRKDLFFLRPVQARLKALEDQVQCLGQALERVQAGSTEQASTLALPIAVAVTLSVLLSFAFYWVSWQQIVGSRFDDAWDFLSAASPFMGAFWLGFVTRRVRLMTCVLVGALIGLLDYTQFFFVYHSNTFAFDTLFYLRDRTPYEAYYSAGKEIAFLASYLVSGLCLFPAGYALAERMHRGATASAPGIFKMPAQNSSILNSLAAVSPALVAALGLAGSVVAAILKVK